MLFYLKNIFLYKKIQYYYQKNSIIILNKWNGGIVMSEENNYEFSGTEYIEIDDTYKDEYEIIIEDEDFEVEGDEEVEIEDTYID